MLEKTAFIDSDFMPPTAERFCLIPESLSDRGFDSVCIKIIDNYPWEFDCRLKSDTAFDEKIIDFLSKKCSKFGVKLIFVFPGEDDYCRLLRLKGYKRMAALNSPLLIIDSEAVGFNSLIELILEDFTSLCPELSSVVLESGSEPNDYISKTVNIIERNGFEPVIIENTPEFISVNKFLDGSDSEADKMLGQLQKAQNSFSDICFGLNVFLTMSSLGSSMPAADRHSLNVKYRSLTECRKEVDSLLKEFKRAAAGKIDEEWLERYLKAITLTVAESSDELRTRIKKFGLLN